MCPIISYIVAWYIVRRLYFGDGGQEKFNCEDNDMEIIDYDLNMSFGMDCSVKDPSFQLPEQVLSSSEDQVELEDCFMEGLPGLGSWLVAGTSGT